MIIEKPEAEKQVSSDAINKRASEIRDAGLKLSPVSTSIDWRDMPDADRKDDNGNVIKGKTHWQKLAEQELKR